MNLSRPFIHRPIATVLLTLGLALAGMAAYFVLPVARLPAVEFPVIFVNASMAGASPADMARTVATRFKAKPRPLRLCYSGEVFRYDEPSERAAREFHQLGVEHIGEPNIVADVEVLLDIAESVGLLRSEAQKGLLSPAVSQELRRQTDAAIADGVFGVPTFIVEGESGPRLFFGQDRLIFVEEALRSHPLMRDEGSTRPPRAVAPTPIGEYGAQVANQARKLTFVYDLSSPFAYLASTQVEKLAAACGAEVEFFPILLGGLFRSIGTPMVPISTYPESKRRHALEDMSRWAHHYGVSFHFPSRFPINTVAALRLLLLAGDNIAPLTHTLFRLYWVGDQDLGDVQVLERALAEVGLDPRLVDRVGEPEVKAKLLANTKQAEEWGCFGVPSFLVAQHHGKPELFFGQDRLLFVEKALRRGTSH